MPAVPRSTRPIREQPSSATLANRDDLGRVTLQGPPHSSTTEAHQPPLSARQAVCLLSAHSFARCCRSCCLPLRHDFRGWADHPAHRWASWYLMGHSTNLKGESGRFLPQLLNHKYMPIGKSLANPARGMACSCKPPRGTSERS